MYTGHWISLDSLLHQAFLISINSRCTQARIWVNCLFRWVDPPSRGAFSVLLLSAISFLISSACLSNQSRFRWTIVRRTQSASARIVLVILLHTQVLHNQVELCSHCSHLEAVNVCLCNWWRSSYRGFDMRGYDASHQLMVSPAHRSGETVMQIWLEHNDVFQVVSLFWPGMHPCNFYHIA